VAFSGPAGEVVQKCEATMHCGFTLLIQIDVGCWCQVPIIRVQIGSGQGDDTDVTTVVCCEPVTVI